MYDVSGLKIWKYWENINGATMPKYIEHFLYQPQKFSSHELIILNEKTVLSYLPNLEQDIKNSAITQVQHKADFIRAGLLTSYGGLWLDCDSIIVKNIDEIFNDLQHKSVVSFTESGILNGNSIKNDPALIQCMAARPGAFIVQDWLEMQKARIKKRHPLKWTEIGASMFDSACQKHRHEVRIRPAITIEPIKWHVAADEFKRNVSVEDYLTPDTLMFMWFNKVNKLDGINNNSLFSKLLTRYG